MNIIIFIVVYIISWWLILFITLPIGIQQDQNPQKGNDSGAPKNAKIKLKITITSIAAFFITFAYFYMLKYGHFDFLNITDAIQ